MSGNVNNENEIIECNFFIFLDIFYVRIVFINVCGLVFKFWNFEFVDVISKYDIICFIEIKIDKVDNIDILNFSVFSKYRLNLLFWKFGGIVVYIRDFLFKFCSIINNVSDNILWIRIEGKIFSIKKYILMGIVYILLLNFRFLLVEIFDDIENEIFNLFKENDCICLLGDFNSRVFILRDFIDVDDFLLYFCNSVDNNSNFDWVVD